MYAFIIRLDLSFIGTFSTAFTNAMHCNISFNVYFFLFCQGLNVALFYENKNPREYFSMVPTSAHSGDGMGNLIALVCEMSQSMLAKRLAYSEELQATVMEVRRC